MQVMPGNKFGFLCLSHMVDGELSKLLLKARSVKHICIKDQDDEENYPWSKSVIFMDYGISPIMESIDEILEQLENIHPSML